MREIQVDSKEIDYEHLCRLPSNSKFVNNIEQKLKKNLKFKRNTWYSVISCFKLRRNCLSLKRVTLCVRRRSDSKTTGLNDAHNSKNFLLSCTISFIFSDLFSFSSLISFFVIQTKVSTKTKEIILENSISFSQWIKKNLSYFIHITVQSHMIIWIEKFRFSKNYFVLRRFNTRKSHNGTTTKIDHGMIVMW